MKKIVRLTEGDLHKIIKDSVSTIINESGNMDYQDVSANILKETPKAYYISVKYFTQKGLSGKDAKMWCPKSCCVLDNIGNITKVAKFILDRWAQEYFDFLKSKGYKSSPISFNMADLQDIADRKKKEKDEYQQYQDEVFSKLVENIKPIIEKNIKELGPYSKMLGLYLSNNGLVPTDKCQKLIQFGDILVQKFGGVEDDAKRFFGRNPDRTGLFDMTNSYANIIYGFSVTNQISQSPKNLKYSASDIIDCEIKDFSGYYGAKKGKLYKMFKTYVDYADKFNDIAFDALNSIKLN